MVTCRERLNANYAMVFCERIVFCIGRLIVGQQLFKELIAYAKAKPSLLTYASSGVGTTSYLSGKSMNVMTGVDIIHVR